MQLLVKVSLPSQERGLKLRKEDVRPLTDLSLPSRERGLKSQRHDNAVTCKSVAPFAGAWIEIA